MKPELVWPLKRVCVCVCVVFASMISIYKNKSTKYGSVSKVQRLKDGLF